DQSWSGSVCIGMTSGTRSSVVPDVHADPTCPNVAQLHGTGLTCYVGQPVLRADGALYGTVCGLGVARREDTLENLVPGFRVAAELLGGLITSAQLAEERLAEAGRAHGQVLRAALTDPVTGLLNRTGLEQAIAQEAERQQRYGHLVTVLVCDVDGLKQVNDTDGHRAGDELLRAVADRLRGAARARDVLGRSGGDEFLLLLPDERRDGRAVERVRRALRDLPVSVGAAESDSARSLPDARIEADARMYRVKLRRKRATSGDSASVEVDQGTVIVDADGVVLGSALQVFRELATGVSSWATIRTDLGLGVVVPLHRGRLVDGRLVLPVSWAQVEGAPRLRSARVMSEGERSALAAWFDQRVS
ncbi:MAG: GGDEF domain-containing protein, partial [Mycobacteriaceae bacterium]